MKIKQIVIEGFKTYKDQTVIGEFAPGTTVIGELLSMLMLMWSAYCVLIVLFNVHSSFLRSMQMIVGRNGSGKSNIFDG